MSDTSIYATKKWIISNCFVKNGSKINSRCCNEQWWVVKDKQHLYVLIEKNTSDLYSFGYRIQLFLNDLYNKKCVECGSAVVNWQKIFCSKKCLYSGEIRNRMMTAWREDGKKAVKCKAKIKSTKKEKYGDENFNNRQKAKETCEAIYGVDNPLKCREIKNKLKETCLIRYGANSYGSSEQGKAHISNVKKRIHMTGISDDAKEQILNHDNLKSLYEEYTSSQVIADMFCLSKSYILGKLHEYGIPVSCNNEASAFEESVFNFLKSVYRGEIIRNDRKLINPQEIDIFIPEKKIAIECNGIYWHSENKGKDKKYHLNKTLRCEKSGYQLFHIFDSDWNDKHSIWQSVLKTALGINDTKIGARQTEIKSISAKEAKSFCEENHLQGSSNAPINYGLFHENELVSVMTFSKARFSRADWELQRFCSKKGHLIHGAASKLLKEFRRNYQGSIVSYANRRWSKGDLYEKLGFEFLHDSPPNYFYFKNKGLESRNKYQKHKLKMMDFYDENLTEYQIMRLNNYNRIWDSGNKVYILNK